MQAEAIAKIKTEINGDKKNPYIKLIGEFLIRHLEANPDDAEKVMATDKTIAKSLDAMKAEAKKKQQNGMAMLTDAEGFAIVFKYFGIKGEVAAPVVASVSNPVPATPASSKLSFDVKLDDFL